MQIVEFKNAALGIRSVVVQSVDGLYDVAAFDTDANRLIEARYAFPTESLAVEYAAKFVSDVIPAGTFVII